MSFNTKKAGDSLLASAGNSPIIKSVISSPIYTSLIIVILIIIIILFTFRDAIFDEPIFTKIIRTGIYSFILTIGIVFLHDDYLMKECKVVTGSSHINELFNGGESDHIDKVPIAPIDDDEPSSRAPENITIQLTGNVVNSGNNRKNNKTK